MRLYKKLQESANIRSLVTDWNKILEEDEEQGNMILIQLLLDCTGFQFEISQGQAADYQNYNILIENLIKTRFIKNQFLPANTELKINVTEFLKALFATKANHVCVERWMANILKLVVRLFKHPTELRILKMVSSYLSMILLTNFSKQKQVILNEIEINKENSSMSEQRNPVIDWLSTAANILFGGVERGFWYEDFGDYQCIEYLNLMQTYPEFYIVENNKLDLFSKIFGIDNRAITIASIQTLIKLFKGVSTDASLNESIRNAVIEYVFDQADTSIDKLLCESAVSILKPTFDLIILVQKNIGRTTMFSKENAEYVINFFMHKNIGIRKSALEYMHLIMDPKDILKKILKFVTKYETSAKLEDVIQTAYDKEIFTDWKIYFDVLQSVRSNEAEIIAIQKITIILKVVFENLHKTCSEEETHEAEDALNSIWNFVEYFTEFLKPRSDTVNANLLSMFDLIKIEDQKMKSKIAENMNIILDLIQKLENIIENSSDFVTIFCSTKMLVKLSKANSEINQKVTEFAIIYTQQFSNYINNELELDGNDLQKCELVSYVCLTEQFIQGDEVDEIFSIIVSNHGVDDWEILQSNVMCCIFFARIFIEHFKRRWAEYENGKGSNESRAIKVAIHYIYFLLPKMENSAKILIQEKKDLKRTEALLFFEEMSSLILCLPLGIKGIKMDPVVSALDTMAEFASMVLTEFQDTRFIEEFINLLKSCINKLNNIEFFAKTLIHLNQLVEAKNTTLANDLVNELYRAEKQQFFAVIATTLLLAITSDGFDAKKFWLELKNILIRNFKTSQIEFVTLIIQVFREFLIKLFKMDTNLHADRFELLKNVDFMFDSFKQAHGKLLVQQVIIPFVQNNEQELNDMEKYSLEIFQNNLKNRNK